MMAFFSILHFLGASFLIGGEPLVALMAVKAEKDDTALKFFISFLKTIVIFMWVGMGLALIGGVGMFLQGGYPSNNYFIIKIVLYVLVAIVSLLLLVNVSKVQAAAAEDFAYLRSNPTFKKMDILSRVDMVLIMAILIVSVLW